MSKAFDPRPGSPLSTREMDVLCLAAHGLPNKLIAPRLGMSRATVHNHLERAFLRLNVHSRIDAFRAVGWLTPPECAA